MTVISGAFSLFFGRTFEVVHQLVLHHPDGIVKKDD